MSFKNTNTFYEDLLQEIPKDFGGKDTISKNKITMPSEGAMTVYLYTALSIAVILGGKFCLFYQQ